MDLVGRLAESELEVVEESKRGAGDEREAIMTQFARFAAGCDAASLRETNAKDNAFFTLSIR